MSDEARRAELQKQIRMGLDLRGWWLREMVATPSPLTERMTLFWHNHFVSAQPKVRYTQLMYRQNVLLRGHALGRFDQLLHAVAKDPAMLIYLDSATNRRGSPNENFAREVMELFTLGEGKYSEDDIKQAARAFTGWSIDLDTGEYTFRRMLHDGVRRPYSVRPETSMATRCSTSSWRSPQCLNLSCASCGASSCRQRPTTRESNGSPRSFVRAVGTSRSRYGAVAAAGSHRAR